ncbi:acyl-CoA dehydrogenase family protein [Streptomyces sp. NPDC016172]|uniref:acyl-CoA dehydrogenase family protein n=1 Tax=Streptomyces sp. NPDC016172 TaxID=3364964 RepID=UPI0036FBA0BE
MDLRPDPLVERLATAVHIRLADAGRDDGTGALAGLLHDMEASAFEASVDAGGYDLGLVCGLVVCRELGRSALPDLYGGGALAQDALTAHGERRDLAAALAVGKESTLVAGLDRLAAPGRAAAKNAPSARPTPNGWELAGTATVDERAPADAGCVVAVPVEGDVLLILLPADTWRYRATPGADSVLSLDLDGLAVDGQDVIGRLGDGTPPTDPAGVLARARVRQAAYLLGLGEGAHALAVRHAATRSQFGRPILDNQAVAFPLAQAEIGLAAVDMALRQATWAADAGKPFAREAVSVAAQAAEAALLTVRVALQTHGASGMRLDSPVHAFHLAIRRSAGRMGPPGALWREAGARRLAARAAQKTTASPEAVEWA